MTPDITPQLIEALRARVKDQAYLSCAEALGVARDLGVPPALVGRACNELGIKLRSCQLGCF
jgi:hypothetical protein